MSNLEQSGILKKILSVLIEKIHRRTSKGYAVVTIETVIKNVLPEYNFLNSVKIKNTRYSEGIDAVGVSSEVNKVDREVFYKAVRKIIEKTVSNLEKNADYFFIKEFKETLDDVDKSILEEIDVNLNLMQDEYISERKVFLRKNNIETLKQVLTTLSHIFNQKLDTSGSMKALDNSIRKAEKKYGFLDYITVSKNPDDHGFYHIETDEKLNDIFYSRMGKAIQEIIKKAALFENQWHNDDFFDIFKREIDEEYLSKLKKIGVSLNEVEDTVSKSKIALLIKKTLTSLLSVTSKKHSSTQYIKLFKNTLQELEKKHNILGYIKITYDLKNDKSVIEIDSKLNVQEPYVIGKALRDLIKRLAYNIGANQSEFIEAFKKELGEGYLNKLKKVGINIHFMEISFA
ncbi:MAG: hypothetical protein V5A68_02300 [Candidatus Thermoplasmatota archaeon]